MNVSTGFTVVHTTSTNTSVGPGRGSSTVPTRMLSAGPVALMKAARTLIQ
jgi:hypothetical protein